MEYLKFNRRKFIFPSNTFDDNYLINAICSRIDYYNGAYLPKILFSNGKNIIKIHYTIKTTHDLKHYSEKLNKLLALFNESISKYKKKQSNLIYKPIGNHLLKESSLFIFKHDYHGRGEFIISDCFNVINLKFENKTTLTKITKNIKSLICNHINDLNYIKENLS